MSVNHVHKMLHSKSLQNSVAQSNNHLSLMIYRVPGGSCSNVSFSTANTFHKFLIHLLEGAGLHTHVCWWQRRMQEQTQFCQCFVCTIFNIPLAKANHRSEVLYCTNNWGHWKLTFQMAQTGRGMENHAQESNLP